VIFIITALMAEAAPIIEHFKLKKDITNNTYQLYRNYDIVLIISGVGKIKSAMAATYLFSTYNSKERNFLINIGFCGTNSSKYRLGTPLLIHKITDVDTNYDYYPDIFIDSTLPREALYCYSKPVKKENINTKEDIFCDMESSGIMEVSKKFTYSHEVVIIKIISDYLSIENLNHEILKNYIKDNILYIEQIIKQLKSLNYSFNELFMEEEENFLDIISDNLRFTTSMKQILLKKIKKAKLEHKEPLKVLKLFTEINVNSKIEGKKIFEQIIDKLK